MSGAPVKLEILGGVPTVDGKTRLIGRLGDKYQLGELRAGGDVDQFVPLTPEVSLDDCARCADNVLAGDPRATTWPHALHVLALSNAVLRLLLSKDEDQAAPEAPAGEPAADTAPAGATAKEET